MSSPLRWPICCSQPSARDRRGQTAMRVHISPARVAAAASVGLRTIRRTTHGAAVQMQSPARATSPADFLADPLLIAARSRAGGRGRG